MAVTFSEFQIEALRLIDKALSLTPWVLVGGMAVALQIEIPRTTVDLDIIVAIDSENLSKILKRLPRAGNFSGPEHSWHYQPGVKFDFVPAGSGAVPASSFIWPESGKVMNITGMHLAFKHALPFQIDENLTIKVAQTRVLLILKMISYMDNPWGREKDLIDIAWIIGNDLPSDDERRWNISSTESQFDYELISPYVVGKEVREIAGVDEIGIVRKFICHIADDIDSIQVRITKLGPPKWMRDQQKMLKFFDAFKQGFESQT